MGIYKEVWSGWKLGSRQGEVRESRGEVDGLRERK